MHNVSDIRQQRCIQLDHRYRIPVVLRFEVGIANLKKYESRGYYEILAELNQAEGQFSVIHKHINCIWKIKNCLISGRILLLFEFKKMAIQLV
jgi:hypothetical protein